MSYTFKKIGDVWIQDTALSVNSRGGGVNWYNVKLKVKLNSQSVENNTSNITIYFDLSSIPSTYTNMWNSYADNTAGSYVLGWKEGSWHNSDVFYMPTSFKSTNGLSNFVDVGSWTVDVPHAADGTLDLDGVRIIYTEGTYTQASYDPASFTRDTTNFVFPTILRSPHVKVKIGNEWKEGKVLVKTSNTVWKPAKEIYIKTDDGWQPTTLRGN